MLNMGNREFSHSLKGGGMQNTTSTFLKAYLWFISLFHLFVGFGLNFFPGFPQTMALYYGAQADWTPQFVYILKPLGAFMFVLGFLAVHAALDPLRNRNIIYGFVILFTLRALQRLIFQNEIYTAFSIDPGRNLVNMVFFFILAAGLWVLFRSVEKKTA